MSWNAQMDSDHHNHSTPYNSIGSFVDIFHGLTYDHANYIFVDVPYNQENAYPAMNPNSYKFTASETGGLPYSEYGHGYVVNNNTLGTNEGSEHLENPSVVTDDQATSVVTDDQATASHVHREGISSSNAHASRLECPQNLQDAPEFEVVWEDNIDPDNMTYEELLELGELVGTQSRGLSQDQIALLPTSKFKWSLFSRKKLRGERCVICQMEYKRRDKRMTLPCKHVYHSCCGSKWLSINKACPICYKEVTVEH